MTAFIEPLPGLLDDPLLHLPDLPSRTDVRIPPLRNPFPSRALRVPSPLEPNAPGDKQIPGGVQLESSKNASKAQRTTPKITPADVISARDTKKPNLAISALVETSSTNQLPRLLPPSFVNLAAVENNSSFPSWLPEYSPSKRVKLDQEHHSDYLQLPKPRQKEASKRVPLLPTIVNGIHEPPPSAALLPPMELEEVKAMLASISEPLPLPPEKMLNPAEPDSQDALSQDTSKPCNIDGQVDRGADVSASVKNRQPRAWKKWSDEETQQLLKGVAKHGAGKWKEICADQELRFRDRRPMDLKDRFRTCIPNAESEKSDSAPKYVDDSDSNSAQGHLRNHTEVRRRSSSTGGNCSKSTGPSRYGESPRKPVEGLGGLGKLKDPLTDLAVALKSRANQRVRKLWTEEEHQNLVKGFAKHGYQWTAIRNDGELNLSHRKATDIRDKFRSLFPQQYMDADSGPPSSRKLTAPIGISKDNAAAQIPPSQPKSLTSGKRPPARSLPLAPPKPTSRPDELSRDGLEPLEASQECSSAPSLTLPPLALGDNDWDWDDNKLAPLLDWEEFGL
jgi:Myb-like DNA-binding domain